MRGFGIHPQGQVGAELRFGVTMPNGLCLPLRLLTQAEAERIAALLNDYVDDETVADMLTTVATLLQGDAVMTDAEAQALGEAMKREPSTIPVCRLPLRPR